MNEVNIKELRIGNLIDGFWEEENDEGDYIEKYGVVRVLGVDETKGLGDGWSVMVESKHKEEIDFYSEFYGIPLSEEWLLKFGFVKSQSKWGWEYFLVRNDYEVYFIIEHWTDTEEGSQWKNHWFNKYTIKPFNLKYIHQLQNLYFGLTGEELSLISE
jgi:hypothetical protein